MFEVKVSVSLAIEIGAPGGPRARPGEELPGENQVQNAQVKNAQVKNAQVKKAQVKNALVKNPLWLSTPKPLFSCVLHTLSALRLSPDKQHNRSRRSPKTLFND